MKRYDISQEVFGCSVFPGDPAPKKTRLQSMSQGSCYNLTALSMCAHNGTHVDAPLHFLPDGNSVDEIPLFKTVGLAFVQAHTGTVRRDDAENILLRLKQWDEEGAKRILFQGDTVISEEAASVFADAQIYLLGCESQSVGPEDQPKKVHEILLKAGIVLLEGIRLKDVSPGKYFLFAAPLKLADSDGAPCRAVLLGGDED